MESKHFWLTRDRGLCARDSDGYNVYKIKPKRSAKYRLGEWEDPEDYFCPKLFERMTGLKLEKGEGPVKVKLIRT